MDLCLIAAGFSWTSPASWWAILQVILGLGAVIFVHELGHFLVAKACGVKCEKFYLGFDAFDIKVLGRVIIPRTLFKWQWGETLYGVGILPLGGYVKMLGQDDNPANTARERERSMMGSDSTAPLPASDNPSAEPALMESDFPAGGPVDRSKMDPRSYQAKSVLQRMAIISAGVIMNLVFAVIFATIAFYAGVNYNPPIIGSTAPGSPAYVAGIDGAEVLSLNGQSTQDAYFPFEYLQEAILLNGGVQPIDFQFKLPDKAEPVSISITPQIGLIPELEDLAALGIKSELSSTIGEPPVVPGKAGARAEPPLMAGDTILEANGEPTQTLRDLRRVFVRNPDRELDLLVERKSKSQGESAVETVRVRVPPNPLFEFGLIVRMEAITAVQTDSPAQRAGLLVGDVITAMDGQPIGDPLSMQHKLLLAARANKAVEFTVSRPNSGSSATEVKITVQPDLPSETMLEFDRQMMGLSGLGIAVQLTSIVASVEPDSPAAVAGFSPGDEITGVKFNLDEQHLDDPLYKSHRNPLSFEELHIGWCDVVSMAQVHQVPQSITVTVIRNSQSVDLTMTGRQSTERFVENRGISVAPIQREYVAQSLWEATTLGADRTRRDMGRVFTFLGKLVRGEVGVKYLGGPGTIAAAATSEATNGFSRLLLFLTLLSANLAIVNFLPIPVLDGGHMMFLTYEGIFRRPVNERVQIILTYLGLLFIVGLMLLVISLDIFRFAF